MKLSRIKRHGVFFLLAALTACGAACAAQRKTEFKTLTPEKSEEMSAQARQSPRTLIVEVAKDGKVTLTRGAERVAEATSDDPAPVAKRLAEEFKERRERQVWKEGFEGRADLPPDERIEKTVFVRAPQNFKYSDVVKVIEAVKGAGASPVGLQTETPEQ